MTADDDRNLSQTASVGDHLSKPFQIKQPEELPESSLNNPGGPTATVDPAVPAALAEEDIFHSEAFESLRAIECQGGGGVVRKVIAFYLEDAPPLMKTIRTAVEHPDAGGLRRAAHSLKSASANLGALRLTRLCLDLERIGASGSVDDQAPALVIAAAAEFERVRARLQAAVDGGDL